MSASFIIGFPEETAEDLNDTLELWLDLMAVRNTEPHGSILVALGGTGYQREFPQPLDFTPLQALALPKTAVLTSAEEELIRAHPAVFPEFYALPYKPLSRQQLKLLEEFMNNGAKTIRFLLVGLRRMGLSGLDIILKWFQYIGCDFLASAGPNYCSSSAFVSTFVPFYRTVLEQAVVDPEERSFLEGLAAAYDVCGDEHESAEAIAGPALTAGVRVTHSSVSMSRLPVRLRGSALPAEALRLTWYLHVTRDGRSRTCELDDRLGEVLSKCDGRTSLSIIARQVTIFQECAKNVAGVAYVVEKLAAQGYIATRQTEIATA